MTREEAIKNIKEHCYFASLLPQAKEALDVAIKALQQQSCGDVISRQAVVEHYSTGELAHCNHISRNNLLDFIEQLPPVTPQPKMGRWIAYEVRLPDKTILNYRCSVCGRKLIGYNTETLSEAPFCHCGAKMIEPQEESEVDG